MKIINGKWEDKYGDSIDNFNILEFIEIRNKVKAVYDNDITPNRIDLMLYINNLSKKEESSLAYLLNQNISISKLAGF